ncbi:MAG: hypothetical protein ABIJ31_03260 [Pseudomonadota bacterium]
MKSNYLITGLLAVMFLITGHFFMAAYTDFCINQSQLDLLRGQERSVKRQIETYQEKLNQLEQVTAFVRQIHQLGLKKDQWDTFGVELKDEPMSHAKLGVILGQTRNTGHYFFKPGKLSIKTGAPDQDTPTAQINQSNRSNEIAQPDSITQPAPLKDATPSDIDITISLDGRFLVKRQGAG